MQKVSATKSNINQVHVMAPSDPETKYHIIMQGQYLTSRVPIRKDESKY